MQGELKVQSRVQLKTDSMVSDRSAKSTEKAEGFTAMLQAKKDQLKQPGQEKAEEADDGGKKNITLSQSGESNAKKKVSGQEEPSGEGKEDDAPKDVSQDDAMERQAAMEQLTAMMAGILPEEGKEEAGEFLQVSAGEMIGAAEGNQDKGVLSQPKAEFTAFRPDAGENATDLKLQAFEVPAVQPEAAQEQEAGMKEALPEQPVLEELSAEVTKEAKTFDPQKLKAGQEQAFKAGEEGLEEISARQAEPKEREAGDAKNQQQRAEENVRVIHREKNPFQTAQKPESSRSQSKVSQTPGIGEREALQAMQEGNGQAAAAEQPKLFTPSYQSFQDGLFSRKSETIPLKTTPETLPQDLGKTLAKSMVESGRTLTVELEPASLGKLTIRMAYDGGRAAVSIMATNPKTQEMLNQRASEIAAILEEKTGQETVIYTQQPEPNQQGYDREPDGKGQEERQEKKQDQDERQQADSFAQQLRLGLV